MARKTSADQLPFDFNSPAQAQVVPGVVEEVGDKVSTVIDEPNINLERLIGTFSAVTVSFLPNQSQIHERNAKLRFKAKYKVGKKDIETHYEVEAGFFMHRSTRNRRDPDEVVTIVTHKSTDFRIFSIKMGMRTAPDFAVGSYIQLKVDKSIFAGLRAAAIAVVEDTLYNKNLA